MTMNDELSESKNNGIMSSLAAKFRLQNCDVCSTCFYVRSIRACINQICHNDCSRAEGLRNVTGDRLLHSMEQSPS